MHTRAEIESCVADARLEIQGRPSVTKVNVMADVIVELSDRLGSLLSLSRSHDLVVDVSKEIHLGEWCPQREKCSGTSAASDAAARAALKIIEERIIAAETQP